MWRIKYNKMKKLKKYYQEELLNYFKDINLKGKESQNNTILDHRSLS